MADVTIVSTGTANLASVLAAFRRIGASAVIARSPEEVLSARRVVLPGVGAFGAAMAELTRTGMDAALVERCNSGASLLTICLGLQLLATSSEESPDVRGLGILPAIVRRLPDGVRLPQLGWNSVAPSAGAQFVSPGFAYFANSYCLYDVDSSWVPSFSDHGGQFIAAVERGPQLACQFHPELSSIWGEELLARWYAGC